MHSDESDFERKVTWIQTMICSVFIAAGGIVAGVGWRHHSEVVTIVAAFTAGYFFRALFARGKVSK